MTFEYWGKLKKKTKLQKIPLTLWKLLKTRKKETFLLIFIAGSDHQQFMKKFDLTTCGTVSALFYVKNSKVSLSSSSCKRSCFSTRTIFSGAPRCLKQKPLRRQQVSFPPSLLEYRVSQMNFFLICKWFFKKKKKCTNSSLSIICKYVPRSPHGFGNISIWNLNLGHPVV